MKEFQATLAQEASLPRMLLSEPESLNWFFYLIGRLSSILRTSTVEHFFEM